MHTELLGSERNKSSIAHGALKCGPHARKDVVKDTENSIISCFKKTRNFALEIQHNNYNGVAEEDHETDKMYTFNDDTQDKMEIFSELYGVDPSMNGKALPLQGLVPG